MPCKSTWLLFTRRFALRRANPSVLKFDNIWRCARRLKQNKNPLVKTPFAGLAALS
jgi:hypothetical protein